MTTLKHDCPAEITTPSDGPIRESHWVCTLEAGHAGQHEAYGLSPKPYAVWWDDGAGMVMGRAAAIAEYCRLNDQLDQAINPDRKGEPHADLLDTLAAILEIRDAFPDVSLRDLTAHRLRAVG